MSIRQDLIEGERWAAQQRRKMGSKKFEEWVKSQQITKFTNFESHDEAKKYVKKAGYNYEMIATNRYLYVKTHIGNEVIYWIDEKGKVAFAVSVNVNKQLLATFMKKVEAIVGRPCFFDSVSATKIPEYNFATIFTDKSTLQQALKNLGLQAIQTGDNLTFEIPKCRIELYTTKNSAYEFKAVGYADLKDIHKYFSKIETEYEKITQKKICENIKTKVMKSPTMQLEQEEVLEDNSILLTIKI